MSELTAKQVLKNKYWIVENSGSKVATIQAVEGGGVVYVDEQDRKAFKTIKLLTKAYNITLVKSEKDSKEKTAAISYEVYGYPAGSRPYNAMWDVKHQFGVYAKSNKSKSFFCAGHYLIEFNNSWVKSFCPKLITLKRYQFVGPFKTKEEATEALKEKNGK